MIDYLLSTSALTSKVDLKGCSALHYAARSGFFHAIQKLLTAGARANVQDQLGYTPLHYAVQSPSDLALVVSFSSFCAFEQIELWRYILQTHRNGRL